MIVTALPISLANVIPIARAKTYAARSLEAVQAELRAEHERHAAVVEGLMHELAGMPPGRAGALRGVPTDELRQTKLQAAATLKITVSRLSSIIARYHRDHPDRLPLAVQPAGGKHGRWIVYTDRVRMIIDSGEPY